MGYHSLLQGIFLTQGSNPGIEPTFPPLQVYSSTAELPAKPNFYPVLFSLWQLSLQKLNRWNKHTARNTTPVSPSSPTVRHKQLFVLLHISMRLLQVASSFSLGQVHLAITFHIFNLFLLLGVCSLLAHIVSLSSELLSPVWLLPFQASPPSPLRGGPPPDVSCFGSALSEHWACYPTLYRISLITSKYNNPGPI